VTIRRAPGKPEAGRYTASRSVEGAVPPIRPKHALVASPISAPISAAVALDSHVASRIAPAVALRSHVAPRLWPDVLLRADLATRLLPDVALRAHLAAPLSSVATLRPRPGGVLPAVIAACLRLRLVAAIVVAVPVLPRLC
jgi:hypothetical protein